MTWLPFICQWCPRPRWLCLPDWRHPFGCVWWFFTGWFGGRIQDCDSCCVITADEGVRGGKPIPLKATRMLHWKTADQKGVCCGADQGRHRGKMDGISGITTHAAADTDCPPEGGAEDPLFILYTSVLLESPGRLTHYGWIYCLRLHGPSICVRLP